MQQAASLLHADRDCGTPAPLNATALMLTAT